MWLVLGMFLFFSRDSKDNDLSCFYKMNKIQATMATLEDTLQGLRPRIQELWRVL